MKSFVTRVELHSANSTDYETLHRVMSEEKFSRFIVGDDGKRYQLPTGTYLSNSSTLNSTQVRDLARRAAEKTGKLFIVITTEGGSSWYLHQV